MGGCKVPVPVDEVVVSKWIREWGSEIALKRN